VDHFTVDVFSVDVITDYAPAYDFCVNDVNWLRDVRNIVGDAEITMRAIGYTVLCAIHRFSQKVAFPQMWCTFVSECTHFHSDICLTLHLLSVYTTGVPEFASHRIYT